MFSILASLLLTLLIAGCTNTAAPEPASNSTHSGDKLVGHSDTVVPDTFGSNSTHTIVDTYQRNDGSTYKVTESKNSPSH
jgi:ABC-type Fe3+-hydroxamate transport system substrate-binding protein